MRRFLLQKHPPKPTSAFRFAKPPVMTSLSGHPAAGNSMQLSAFSQGQNLTKVLRRNILKDLQKNVVSMCVSRSFPYFSWVKKLQNCWLHQLHRRFRSRFSSMTTGSAFTASKAAASASSSSRALDVPETMGFYLKEKEKQLD